MEIVQTVENLGARKPLCIIYSMLAAVGISMKNEELSRYAAKALKLTSEMHYIHGFIISYEMYQPLICYGLIQGLEVPFLQKTLMKVGKRAIPLLKNIAAYKNPEIRERVILPLAQIGSDEALGILEELTRDANTSVADKAEKLLLRRKPANVKIIESNTGDYLLKLYLLGSVALYSGEEDLTCMDWVRRKSRDLLLFMAHYASPVRKEQIIDALWPEAPFQKANTLFHTTMHTLRSVINNHIGETDLILYRAGRYHFASGTVYTDKQHFKEMIVSMEHSNIPNEQEVSMLEEAVALYRGDYLKELDYTWILPEQERLRQLHNKAGNSLSLFYIKAQNYQKAIVHLERLMKDNPLSEEYCLRLLQTYARLNDIHAINLHYHRLSAVLIQELGLKPLKEIRKLYTQLINSR